METRFRIVEALFSLEEPGVADKIVQYLRDSGVRVAFHELCILFGCEDITDRLKLQLFLRAMHKERKIIEIASKLYCHPVLRGDVSFAKLDRREKNNDRPRGKTWGPRDAARTERETAQFIKAARTQSGVIPTRFFVEYAGAHGIEKNRIAYLLQTLCHRGLLARGGKGKYVLTESDFAAAA